MHAFGRSFGLEKTTAPFLFYFSFLFFLIKIIRWVFRPWYDFVSLTPKHKTLFVLLGWDIFMLWDANSCWKQLNIQLCQNHVLHIYNSCNVEPIRVKASGPMWLRVCLFFFGRSIMFLSHVMPWQWETSIPQFQLDSNACIYLCPPLPSPFRKIHVLFRYFRQITL